MKYTDTHFGLETKTIREVIRVGFISTEEVYDNLIKKTKKQ